MSADGTGKASIPGSQSSDNPHKRVFQSFTASAAHVASIITNATSVTPHATNANVYSRLWIGVSGDIEVRLSDMTSGSVIFKNVPIGFFPVSTTLILAAGTTASEILGLV